MWLREFMYNKCRSFIINKLCKAFNTDWHNEEEYRQMWITIGKLCVIGVLLIYITVGITLAYVTGFQIGNIKF